MPKIDNGNGSSKAIFRLMQICILYERRTIVAFGRPSKEIVASLSLQFNGKQIFTVGQWDVFRLYFINFRAMVDWLTPRACAILD
jgi:hypothetical protein